MTFKEWKKTYNSNGDKASQTPKDFKPIASKLINSKPYQAPKKPPEHLDEVVKYRQNIVDGVQQPHEEQIRQIGGLLYPDFEQFSSQHVNVIQLGQQKVDAALSEGLAYKNNFDTIDVGSEEFKKQVVKRYGEYSSENANALHHEYWLATNRKIKQYYELKEQQEQLVLDQIALQRESVKNLIGRYRKMGRNGVEIPFQDGSSTDLIRLVNKAYDLLPSGWSELSARDKKMAMKVVSDERGYYNKGGQFDIPQLGLKITDSDGGVATTIHELTHRQEQMQPLLRRAEFEFYARRTDGEEAQKISVLTGNSNYEGNEIARPDNFLNPYFGKDYGNNG